MSTENQEVEQIQEEKSEFDIQAKLLDLENQIQQNNKKHESLINLIKKNQTINIAKSSEVEVKTDLDYFKELAEEVVNNPTIMKDFSTNEDIDWQTNALKCLLAYDVAEAAEMEIPIEDVYTTWKNDFRWKDYLKSKISK